MRDLDHALSLIDAVVAAVDVPVTLKTRLGWDEACHNAPELARRAVGAGVKMVTIHGRTRCQFLQGPPPIGRQLRRLCGRWMCRWSPMGILPVLRRPRQALAQSGAGGVMVGRGAQGRPWLLAQIAASLSGRPVPPAPQGAELVAFGRRALRRDAGLLWPRSGPAGRAQALGLVCGRGGRLRSGPPCCADRDQPRAGACTAARPAGPDARGCGMTPPRHRHDMGGLARALFHGGAGQRARMRGRLQPGGRAVSKPVAPRGPEPPLGAPDRD